MRHSSMPDLSALLARLRNLVDGCSGYCAFIPSLQSDALQQSLGLPAHAAFNKMAQVFQPTPPAPLNRPSQSKRLYLNSR